MQDIPFYKKQKRLALHRNGVVDPCNIYDSIREDGYAGLAKVLTGMTPDEVIDIVKKPNFAAAAAQVSRQGSSGSIPRNRAPRSRPWSATATKAIRARSWTARSWKAIPIPSWKA